MNNQVEAIIRDKKVPTTHCRHLEADYTPRKQRKTVIILPGNASQSAQSANGMCKIVEDMLGKYAPFCDIMSFYYPDLAQDLPRDQIWQSAKEIGQYIYQNSLRPLVSDYKDGKPHRISANVAAENMRNVMFFTHCYGSYVVETIEQEFKNELKTLNYTPAEQEYILKQLFVMHNNNVSEHLGEYEPSFTHLQRFTKSDRKRQKIKYPSHSFQQYIQDELLTKDEVLLVPLQAKNHVLLAEQLTVEGGDEHNGAQWGEKKTKAGQIEEEIACGLLCEFATSKKPLENLAKEINNAKNHHFIDILPDDLEEIIAYGQEYADDYQEYRQLEIAKTQQNIAAKICR